MTPRSSCDPLGQSWEPCAPLGSPRIKFILGNANIQSAAERFVRFGKGRLASATCLETKQVCSPLLQLSNGERFAALSPLRSQYPGRRCQEGMVQL